jgi:branched-subunit amino acid transport protein
VSTAWLILVLAVTSYVPRIAGFGLRGRPIPERFERFLSSVPIAAFAVLIVTGMDIDAGGFDARVLAAAPAAAAAWRWRKLWLTLLVGMISYWITRAIL